MIRKAYLLISICLVLPGHAFAADATPTAPDNPVAKAASNMFQSFSALSDATMKSDASILATSSQKPDSKTNASDSSASDGKSGQVVSSYYLGLIGQYGKDIGLKDLSGLDKGGDNVVSSIVTDGDSLVTQAISSAAASSKIALQQEAQRTAAADEIKKTSVADRIASGDFDGASAKSGQKKMGGGFGYNLLKTTKPSAPQAPASVSGSASGQASF